MAMFPVVDVKGPVYSLQCFVNKNRFKVRILNVAVGIENPRVHSETAKACFVEHFDNH